MGPIDTGLHGHDWYHTTAHAHSILVCTMLRLWYGVLAVAFYLEPPVIAYLGDACPDRMFQVDDRLWQLLAPFHEGLALHAALSSLLLCVYNGLFLIHVFVAVHRKVYHDEGRLLLTELALLLTASVLLHATSCSHRDTGAIYSTGQLAADTVLSPTHAVSNAWFAPRLAWALLLLQERELGAISQALVLLLVLLCGALLHQLDVRTFALSCAVAWSLVPPRAAQDAYKRLKDAAAAPGSPRDTQLFTIGEVHKGSTSVSSNSSSGGAVTTAAPHNKHGFLDEDDAAAYDEYGADPEDGRHLPHLNDGDDDDAAEDEHGLHEIDLRAAGTPRPHRSLQPVTPRTPKVPASPSSSTAAAASKAAASAASQTSHPRPPQIALASRTAPGAAVGPAAAGVPPQPLPHSELP